VCAASLVEAGAAVATDELTRYPTAAHAAQLGQNGWSPGRVFCIR
jgi:hypothetical protein